VLSLRPYYHPMQSVIPAEEKGVTYTEFLPCEALRPFIYCHRASRRTLPVILLLAPNSISIDLVTYSAPK